MNVFLVTMFVGNQPIRIHQFLKVNCVSFLKKLQSLFEKRLPKKHLNFLELLYKKKERKMQLIFLLMK